MLDEDFVAVGWRRHKEAAVAVANGITPLPGTGGTEYIDAGRAE